MIEVTASCDVNVPSRLEPDAQGADEACGSLLADEEASAGTADAALRPAAAEQVQGQLSELQAMVKQLCRRSAGGRPDLPEELFRLFTDLLDSDLSEDVGAGAGRAGPRRKPRRPARRPVPGEDPHRADDRSGNRRRRTDPLDARAAAGWSPWSAPRASARRRRSPSSPPTIACATNAASD